MKLAKYKFNKLELLSVASDRPNLRKLPCGAGTGQERSAMSKGKAARAALQSAGF